MSRSSRPAIRNSQIEGLYSASVRESVGRLGCKWPVERAVVDEDEEDAPTVVVRPSFKSLKALSVSTPVRPSPPLVDLELTEAPPSTLRDPVSWSDRIPVDVDDEVGPATPPTMSMRAMRASVPLIATSERPPPPDWVRSWDSGSSPAVSMQSSVVHARSAASTTQRTRAPSIAWRCARLLLIMILLGFVASASFLVATKRGRAPAHAAELAKKTWHSVVKLTARRR